MPKLLRYALATLSFTLSFAVAALWAWSASHPNRILGASWHSDQHILSASVDGGNMAVSVAQRVPGLLLHSRLQFRSATLSGPVSTFGSLEPRLGRFDMRHGNLYFPLWYPAMVLALAGGAALRVGRRFTLRTAIMATTLTAVVLGIIVAL